MHGAQGQASIFYSKEVEQRAVPQFILKGPNFSNHAFFKKKEYISTENFYILDSTLKSLQSPTFIE